MRLFTGISIPADISEKLSLLIDRLRPAGHVRWSPAYNLHITTKFIGEWPEERLQEIINALQPLRSKPAAEISVSGLGWLPNPHAPRVLFCAVKAGEQLPALAAATEAALTAIGVPAETRSFKPHLTLARIKDSGTPLGPLRQTIASLDSTDFGTFTVKSFSLYHSKPGPAGSIYTQLAEVPLQQ